MEEGRFRNGPRNELITIVFHPWVKIGTLLARYKMKDRTIRKQPINHMYKNDLFDLVFRLLHSFCRSSRPPRKERERKARKYLKAMVANARLRSFSARVRFLPGNAVGRRGAGKSNKSSRAGML